MRIKSLTLQGFKSFADRTTLELHDGITAIVGPNGCGKSNISDALRWVLGEQRPTAIRGSRMEEAIFGGTESRRPIHRAEVTLELSNEDGTLPVPYSEVEIGRTVYRGGESEYSLNGSPCRLKDLQDLCRDTGLGANAYAMIESRMVDAILSDRAEERRALFEEAAEIGRYKDRRRVALRRLEQAESDLQRLDDVLGEVQSKVRSLAQQRGRAERHATFRERLLRLEVAVADARLERTSRRLAEAEGELEALERARPSEEADLQTAEVEAETKRVELAELERTRAGVARRLDEARQAVEASERARLVARERAGAARQRVSALDEELEMLERRREELEESRGSARASIEQANARHAERAAREAELRARVEALEAAREAARGRAERAREGFEEARRAAERFETELESAEERARERAEELERRRPALADLEALEETLRASIEAASERASEASARLEEVVARLEARREARAAATVELRELRERAGALEGELSAARARAAGLAALLASTALLPETVAELLDAGIEGVEGPLARFVDTPGEWAAAVEAHLGPHLHGVVVRDWQTVERVQAWLDEREDPGRVLLLPLSPGPLVEEDEADEAALLTRVRAHGAGSPWVRALLGRVEARDAPGAPRPSARPWVRTDGRRQDRWGAVHLGRPGGGDGVLSRRAELGGLRERVERIERDLADARRAIAEAEAGRDELVAEVEELEAARREAETARREAEAERGAERGRLARVAEERGELSRRIERLEASREAAVELTEDGATRRSALEREATEAERAFRRERDAAAEAREAVESERAKLHDLQLEVARAEASLSAGREALARLEESSREADERKAALRAEREEQARAARDSERRAAKAEEVIATGLERRSGLERELSEIEARLEERRADLEAREATLREARRAEREHADRRHALELEVTRLRAARASVHERLEAEWDASLDELRDRVEPLDGEDATADLEAWEGELDEVRRAIARIGPVNLLAQQEYDEEKERLDFLLAQRDDLLSARDDLSDSIRRINRSAAEAFSETFEQVRENFRRTFRSLFEGGDCDLWLEDPDDPLDAPIEISASPRGKRTQRIHLLSGGERALTALALLFAIYLAKPSPFCLMDEVDAPLDETNILRFVGMLEEFKKDTQFIIITHNPRTIEAADWIYGVTMQEPGVSSIVGVRFEDASQVA